ncbi:glutamate receptor 1-like isoform X2 [Anneissia japonica]|uniref:glutamate receptor 1-like isoform X2 n=1 Tax=Anneissia japonica TaxID=1529436 RepID=UPI0014255253|nr:glutamate receptor 1-like isoform X2 [Anneissia japonica]
MAERWISAVVLVALYVGQCFANQVSIGAMFGEETGDGDRYKNIIRDAIQSINQNSSYLTDTHLATISELKLTTEYTYSAIQDICNTMVRERRLSAMIVPEDICKTCRDVAGVASHASMPIFGLDQGSLNSGSLAFKMYPAPEDMGVFLIEILDYFKWRDFIVMYDYEEIFRNLEPVVSAGNRYDWNVTSRQLTEDNFPVLAEQLKEGRVKNILLYTQDETTTYKILREAMELGVLSSGYHWVLANVGVFIDRTFLEEISLSQVYLTRFALNYTQELNYAVPTTINVPLRDWPFREKLAFDAVIAIGHGIRRYRERVHLQDPSILERDILPGDSIMEECPSDKTPPVPSPLYQDMQYFNFEGLSGNVAFGENGNRVNYSIMIISGQGETIEQVRGEWAQNIEFWEERWRSQWRSNSRMSVDAYRQASERILKIVSIEEPPFLRLTQYDINDDDRPDIVDTPNQNQNAYGNDRFEGYIMDLLAEIKKVIPADKFDYEVDLVSDNKYGSRNLFSNEWTGMIGEIIRGRADIAAGPLTITEDRDSFVDFSIPFMRSGIQILIKHPSYVHEYPFSMMYPFGVEVWFINAMAMFLFSLFMFLINRKNPAEWRALAENGDVYEENADNFSFRNSTWFSVSSMFLQSYDASPRSQAGRVLTGFWWMFCLIMIFLYGLNVSPYMTAAKKAAFIRTAKDLLEQIEVNYGCVKEGSTYDFFKNSTDPDYQRIWGYISTAYPDPLVDFVSDGVRRVRESNGEYALLAESAILKYEAYRKPCDLLITDGFITRSMYGFAVQAGSPLRDQLSYAIEKLFEDGTMDKLEDRWFGYTSDCEKETLWERQGLYSLTAVDLQGVYYLMLIGIGCALFVYFIELLAFMLVPPTDRRGQGY